MTGRTARRRITRIRVGDPSVAEQADLLAGEEPLGIRIGGQAVSLTMRTPGDDVDLTAGFLVSEGVVSSAADIAGIRICDGTACAHAHQSADEIGNIADVTLAPGVRFEPDLRRSFLTSSACGVCGKTSVAELRVSGRFDLRADQVRVGAEVLAGLPDALRSAQRVFDRTGGLHAAGLFTADGELLAVREDVGRHNAVDKLVGWALQAGPAAAERVCPAGERAGLVRARAEGRPGRRSGAGRRFRAVVAGRRARAGSGPDAGRLPARLGYERLQRPGADQVAVSSRPRRLRNDVSAFVKIVSTASPMTRITISIADAPAKSRFC